MTNPFYGGGHITRSHLDFAYWCQEYTTAYYTPEDVYTPPSMNEGPFTYQRIVNCAAKCGVDMPPQFDVFFAMCEKQDTMMKPDKALNIRGAVLFSHGQVLVSLGDGRRVIYEVPGALVMKFLNLREDPNVTFEYGALVPGIEYHR